MNPVPPGEKSGHRGIFWISILITGIFYYSVTKPAPKDAYGAQFFYYLAEGFRDGHLYMSLEPDPRMAQLPNAYDPQYNNGIRMHDASYYKGHNYLYYGPSPIVTLYLPVLWLGYQLQDWMAALVFAFLGFVGWACLLRMLVRVHFPQTHGFLLGLCYASIALGSYVTFQLSYPRMYEVAVLSAQCFLAWAIFFVLAGLLAGLRWIDHHPKPKLATTVFILLTIYGCALMCTATIRGYYP